MESCEASNSVPPDCGHRRYFSIQSGKTMLLKLDVLKTFRHPIAALIAVVLIAVVCMCSMAAAFQVQSQGDVLPPNNQMPANAATTNTSQPNNSDGFAASAPVMTFVDQTGQPYGRYVINEAVPVVNYSFQQVTERIYMPKTVTENKTVTKTQYTPIYSYQPQLRNVPSSNPFASPKQVWQNVLVVQYQPSYVQVNEPVTYQKYELQDVPRMVPILLTQSEQRPRFVDRPLVNTPNGANAIATNPSNLVGGNIVQQPAQTAQDNRNAPRFPTSPIGYSVSNPAGNYAGYTYGQNPNSIAQAPLPYYPNTANPAYSTSTYASNSVLPAVPVQQSNPSGQNLVASNQPVQQPYPASYQPYPASYQQYPASYQQYPASYPPSQPMSYTNTASLPVYQWPAFVSATGSLFSSDPFGSTSKPPSYVASNASVSQPYSQPYIWGNSNPSPTDFRPNSSPYATPPPTWGMSPASTYRDPMQGGMQATELR